MLLFNMCVGSLRMVFITFQRSTSFVEMLKMSILISELIGNLALVADYVLRSQARSFTQKSFAQITENKGYISKSKTKTKIKIRINTDFDNFSLNFALILLLHD